MLLDKGRLKERREEDEKEEEREEAEENDGKEEKEAGEKPTRTDLQRLDERGPLPSIFLAVPEIFPGEIIISHVSRRDERASPAHVRLRVKRNNGEPPPGTGAMRSDTPKMTRAVNEKLEAARRHARCSPVPRRAVRDRR